MVIVICIDLDEYCDKSFVFDQCWDWLCMFVDIWIFACSISQHDVFYDDILGLIHLYKINFVLE
jgi:hypothetical protein